MVNDLKYKTIVRDVKHPRVEYKTGSLVIIIPKGYTKEKELVARHRNWIEKKKSSISSAMKTVENKKLDVPKEKQHLQEFVQTKTEEYCKHLRTKINKVYFRKMRTKWGSCSHSNNLTLNSLLAYLPEHLIEYVVFHEIAHTKEMKHASNFWDIIERKFKDHQKREMELFGYWFLIQKEIKNEVKIA